MTECSSITKTEFLIVSFIIIWNLMYYSEIAKD